MSSAIGNAKQFSLVTLKCVSGQIPKQINGSYFRNGPGRLNFGEEVVSHWFHGDGCILKLKFSQGECKAQMKFIDTPLYKSRTLKKGFSKNFFYQMWSRLKQGKQFSNPANTSVLCLKNKPNILALCEAGEPFILKKENLNCQGFTNFGWISSAFSAHPKIDPQNGDIYNIGMNRKNINIMKATKDFQKICQAQFPLRELQSIHDVCLAGDYLVMIEGPIKFNLKDFVLGGKFFFNCKTIDQSLPTLVHIYSKDNLKHIKTLNLAPFYCFHFTNGFSKNQKIVVEYFKYDVQSSKSLFRAISQIPNFSQSNFNEKYKGTSTLQELTINLQDFTTKTKSVKLNGQFPVCQDHQTGKQWRYTYAVGSQQNQIMKFNTIYRYDRINDELNNRVEQGNVHINEPAIIRTNKNLYLMCIINRDRNSYAEIFQAQTLKKICQLQLPEFIPAGFHGKWEAAQQ